MLDFHAWIEMPNGKIIDWDMKSYNLKKHLEYCSHINNGDKDFEPIYIKWENIDIDTKKIIDNMIEERENELKSATENDIKVCWNMIKNKPKLCINRAIILKHKNPTAKIVFGSLGLKDKKGNIWFEYGNGSINSIDKPKHIRV